MRREVALELPPHRIAARMASAVVPRTLLIVAIAALVTPPGASGEEPEVHTAPEAQRENAPPEAVLSPPPDAEKSQPSPGYVRVRNPAFPAPEVASPAPPPAPSRKYDAADVAPYFAADRLAEAKRLFDRGAFADARKVLADQGDSPPVRYLRALCAMRAEDWAVAADEMAALADAYPAMRDRCLTHAGLAFSELSKWERAAELLAGVPDDSRLYSDARLALARALRSAKKLDEAVAALEPLAARSAPAWGRNAPAEALWLRAEIERSRKRPDAERDALERLWGSHPLTNEAKQAESRLNLKKVPLARVVDRAEALVESHRNRRGIDLLSPRLAELKLPDSLACRAHFVLGKALRKERSHTRAIEVLEPVVQQCTDADLRPRALYVLGSSKSIVAVADGPRTYQTLARDYPAHTFADDALFYAADLHQQNGRLEEALAELATVGERYADGDFAGEALFKAFWIRRQRGETKEAFAVLDRIEASFANRAESYDVERAQYWRARMHESGGQNDRAAELFATLAVEHPATYYGLIARRRLAALSSERAIKVAEQLDFPAAGRAWPLEAGPLAEDRRFLAGVELLRLGFPDAVSTELLAADRTRASGENLRLLVQLLSLAGDARSAHALARTSLRRELSGRITAETRPVWELAYPLAFRPTVQKHCETVGLDPDLLQALMREESALDPQALSWAGALGLTQLMPYTAKAVARRLKIGNLTTSRLLDPEVNIRIGSAYLADLVKKWEGTPELALASYNAGAGAVARWRRDRPGLELDEWVEEIPISETRGYVKRVLRSYNTYQLLYAASQRQVTVAPQH
jgi:soluble lytic murein transglycosylase